MPIRKFTQSAILCLLALALASCSGFFTNRDDSGSGGSSNVLYVANFNGGGTGTLSLFNVNNTSAGLSVVGNDVSTGSSTLANGPTSLAIVSSKFLYSANDGGGVSAFSIGTGGALGTISGSPFAAGTNPIAIAVDPSNKFIYVANSGSQDISVYSVDATTGALTQVAGSPFPLQDSPFGITVSPNGNFLYAAIDLTGIEAFTINRSTGALTLLATTPPLGSGRPQAVITDSGGRFLFAADGITTGGVESFKINANGTLTAAANSAFASGDTPVALATDSAGKFLFCANFGSNDVTSFLILNDGTLSKVGNFASGSNPTALLLDSAANALYVANFRNSPGISIFTLDSSTQGKLVSAGSASAGTNPAAFALK